MFRIFLPPAGLASADRKLLLLLAAAFFIAQYDMSVLSLALPDMQASFNISEQDLGKVIAAARLGALPAIFLALMADRIGRRRLLMVTLLGLSIATGATGFVRTAEQFILVQFCSRAFATAEEIIAVIYVLEMLPARHRGWGVGFLAAMGGLGSGAASLLYAMVDFLPGGWRAMYVIAAVPIIYLAWLRRMLPESEMFDRHVKRDVKQLFWQPVLEIYRDQRREMAAIALIAAMFSFQLSPTMNFMSKYLQETHDYSPPEVSLLFVLAGSIALFGTTTAGRISDRIGRRPTMVTALLLNCLASIAFYNTSGFVLPLAWIAALFSFFAIEVLINAMGGELFPTRTRSTASTLRAIAGMLAAVAGLTIEGALFNLLGSHAAAISVLTLSSLLAIPVVILLLRETANTELS